MSTYENISLGVGLFMSSILANNMLQNCSNNNNNNKTEIDTMAVNFHFTRNCNYHCKFCFHTNLSGTKLPDKDCFKILKKLREYGVKKINFAGGEPFLYAKLLGEMIKYSKEVCKYESVSIISNASLITEKWMEEYHSYLDILGVSCDSMNDETNNNIGRSSGNGKKDNHVANIRKAALLANKYQIKFKINTVVNKFNYTEDMSSLIKELKPMRWKIFQVLQLEGENSGPGAKTDVLPLLINSVEFEQYVHLHTNELQKVKLDHIMRIEDNSTMQSSYVLVDEEGYLLDSSLGGKTRIGLSLARDDVSVEEAMKALKSSTGGGYDHVSFNKRDGDYRQGDGWSNGNCKTSCNGLNPMLVW